MITSFNGRTALVTGASSGLGVEFARQLAADGADLVLVARRAEPMEELAGRLRTTFGVQVTVLPTDLAEPGATVRLVKRLQEAGIEVDLLVNNAGFGWHGDLVGADPERMKTMIDLNCTALVDLTTRLLPGMLARGECGVLNVASTAAYQPVPQMAVYGATKAFVLSFSEALWAETRGRGVTVTVLSPGATATEFFRVAGESASFGRRATASEVVATGLRAWRRGAPSVISGRLNAAMASSARFSPRRLTVLVAQRMMKGG
jgi:short-subunit dehydrogenase